MISRPRFNQPSGWNAGEHGGRMPETHYAVRHNYVYYPIDWVDSATGRQYKKGYYDENGQYYEDVVFLRNGKYENVICECEYCGSVAKVDWSGDGQAPNCKNCGAVMTVRSALDEYTQDPGYSNRGLDHYGGVNYGSSRTKKPGCLIATVIGVIVIAVMAIFAMIAGFFSDRDPGYSYPDPDPGYVSNVDIFGENIYLDYNGDGEYVISDDGDATFDKVITWDYGEDCYYDRDTDLFLWYNTDVSPNIWQYWYEPISGDFGDYGWMEYEPGQWYIEVDWGDWQEVPSTYDTDVLWHFPFE